MVLPMFVLLAIAVFIIQLAFCFYAKKLWIKLLPIVLAAVMDILCWLLYFLGAFSDVYGGDFAAFIYGMILLVVAAVSGFGWAIYGIVKLVQNRKK